MPLRGASHYRVRSLVVAVVIGGHVGVLALLAIQQVREPHGRPDERMALVILEPANPPRPVEETRARTAARRSTPAAQAPDTAPAAADSTAITAPGANIDWYADGADAAQRATGEPTTRDFGFPRREPAPRQKKEFGWDKTHTERVQALDGGGIGIHLSDNCDLIIAPLPLAGCAFGKRKARGDLFDEMKAPVEPGDWKDR